MRLSQPYTPPKQPPGRHRRRRRRGLLLLPVRSALAPRPRRRGGREVAHPGSSPRRRPLPPAIRPPALPSAPRHLAALPASRPYISHPKLRRTVGCRSPWRRTTGQAYCTLNSKPHRSPTTPHWSQPSPRRSPPRRCAGVRLDAQSGLHLGLDAAPATASKPTSASAPGSVGCFEAGCCRAGLASRLRRCRLASRPCRAPSQAASHRIWRARFGSQGRRALISSTPEACEVAHPGSGPRRAPPCRPAPPPRPPSRHRHRRGRRRGLLLLPVGKIRRGVFENRRLRLRADLSVENQ